MGRSSETFGKKEVRNKRAKKRKDKAERRQEKKEQGKQNFDDMIAYVDENGVITDTPPEVSDEEVDPDSIEIAIPKKEAQEEEKPLEGVVAKFDESRNFGFINVLKSKDSFFVHMNDCIDEIAAGNRVTFEVERGLKGMKAVNVKLVQ